MPPQIKRHLIILVFFVALFLVIRYLLIPDSFGELGHYRADSLEDNKSFDLHYAGKEPCIECHDDMGTLIASGQHRHLSCEVCHGPGMQHTETTEAADIRIPEGREHCGLCHGYNPAKNEDMIIQVNLQEHYVNYDCKYCHNPHIPWELKIEELPEESL